MSSAAWVESCVQSRWGCDGVGSRNTDLEALIWSYPACYDGESLANRQSTEPNPKAFGADLRKHERSPAREESNVFPSNFRSNASCFSAGPNSFGPKTDGELNDIITGGTRLLNQEASSGPSPAQRLNVASQSSQQAGQVQHERESLDIPSPVVIRPHEDLLQPDTLPADDQPLLIGGAPNRDPRAPCAASSNQKGWMNTEMAAPTSAHQQQQLQRQRQRQMQVAATLGSNRGGSDVSFETSTMSGQGAARSTPCVDALSVNDGRCFPSTLPPEILDDSYVRMMTIAPEVVGWVIGRNGCNIKDIKQASGCELWIDQRELVLYTAGPSVRQLDNAIKSVRELISRAPVNVNSAGLGDEVWKKMIDCPPHLVGLLIGRGGSTIKRIKEESKANVVINQKMMKVIVSGLPDSVQRGVTMIEDVISFGNSSDPGRSGANAHRFHASEHSGVPRRGGSSSQGVGNATSERFSGRSKGVSPMPGGGRLPSPAPRYAGGLRHSGAGSGGRMMSSPYNGLQGESNWGGGGVVPSTHFAQPKERRGSNRVNGQGRGQYRQSAATVGSNCPSTGRHHKANTWPGNPGPRAEMKSMDCKGADLSVLAAHPFDLAGAGAGLDRRGPRHPQPRNQLALRLVSGHQQLTGSAIRGGGGGGTVGSSGSGGAHLDVPRSPEVHDQRSLASSAGRNGGGSPPPVDHTCIEVPFDSSGVPGQGQGQGFGQSGRLRERAAGSPIGKPGSLAEFLGEMGLAKYLRVMKENEIDFETMNLMANIDFQDIGIPKGPRVKLLYAVRTNRYPPKSGDISAMKSFLASLGLERLCPVFEEQEVDMAAIDVMEEPDFAELGVAKGPRLKVLNVVSNLGKRGNYRYPMPQPALVPTAEGGPPMAVDWLHGDNAEGKGFEVFIVEGERSSSSLSMTSASIHGDMRSLSPVSNGLDAALEVFAATGSPQARGPLGRPVLVEAD